MSPSHTGAERYLAERLQDPEYVSGYKTASTKTERIDQMIRALDERRIELNLSKADVARRVGMRPESVRRTLGKGPTNIKLGTLLELASALDLEITAVPAS